MHRDRDACSVPLAHSRAVLPPKQKSLPDASSQDRTTSDLFDDTKIGDSASLHRTLHPEDLWLFAVGSGGINSAWVDQEYARSTYAGFRVNFRLAPTASPCRQKTSRKRAVAMFIYC